MLARDYILLYVNGRRYAIRGEAAFSSLSEFLRRELLLPGTKVVCAEGDCGACTVLVGRPDETGGRYQTADACILFLHQLDGRHVVTVEGLADGDCLTPVQQAIVDHHGSQCGYCTPGFVMALTGILEDRPPADAPELRLALTGNLCRCTGYLPILEAAAAVRPEDLIPLARRYHSPALVDDLRRHSLSPVRIETTGPVRRTFFAPRRLEDALEFKARHPESVIIAGATELGVLRNKRGYEPAVLLSLADVPGLSDIVNENSHLVVGANVTWTQMERFSRAALPELYRIIIRFGSPQIRNVSTLAGNVANGSPIADSLPFLFVMEAELELVSQRGSRRVPIGRFYQGYKKTDLTPDEIIARLIVPLPAPDELLKLYKVSRRNDLDIATFGAGIRLKKAGEVITRAYLAYSGVGPMVERLPRTESFLQGKLFTAETFQEAGRVARSEIRPISDVRGAHDFRLQLAENILGKFYWDCTGADRPVGAPAG
jgi:xanthine dehydrogenase small subunit